LYDIGNPFSWYSRQFYDFARASPLGDGFGNIHNFEVKYDSQHRDYLFIVSIAAFFVRILVSQRIPLFVAEADYLLMVSLAALFVRILADPAICC